MPDKTKASDDLLSDLDLVIGRGPSGNIYALKSTADEVVKEVELDGITSDAIELIEAKLYSMQFFKHPNLLEYKQVVRDGDTFYLRMRRCKSSLEQMIKLFKRRRITIPETTAIDIVYQISSALQYLHTFELGSPSNGGAPSPIAMQYLQPSQVLIAEDNGDNGAHYVLSDFCLPKNMFSNSSSFETTSMYRAPESIGERDCTPASDMWSVGCILYELMTMSAPPFIKDADDNGTFPEGWEPDLSKVESTIGQEIIKRLLVVEPKGRLSARQLVSLLRSDEKQEGALMALKLKLLEMRCMNYNKELAILQEKYQKQEAEMAGLKERLLALEMNHQPHGNMPPTASSVSMGQKETRLATDNRTNDEQRWTQRAEAAYKEHPGLLLLDSLADIVQSSYSNAIRDDVPNAPIDDGTSDLMYAAQEGNIEMVQQLVELEKCLQNKSGWTALMIALMQRHAEVALFLVPFEKGIHDNTGKTALMWAAQNGMTDVAKVLTPYEKGLRDILGQTALMVAAQNGNADIVQHLVIHENRMQDTNGETALLKAIHWGHASVVKLLLPFEQDLRDRKGRTALDHAKAEGRQAITSLFSKA